MVFAVNFKLIKIIIPLRQNKFAKFQLNKKVVGIKMRPPAYLVNKNNLNENRKL